MTRQGGAGRRPRGSSLGSGRDPHCRARGLRLLQLRVQTAPQDSSPLPEAQQLQRETWDGARGGASRQDLGV